MHQISKRMFTDPFVPPLFAYCPTLDLVATVTAKGSVDVWRLNGQRVFGFNFPRDEEEEKDVDMVGHAAAEKGIGGNVRALAWRRDGKIAHRIPSQAQEAVSYVSSPLPIQTQARTRSSRVSSVTTSQTTPSRPNVTTISWTTHFVDPSPTTVRSRLDAPHSSVSLDQILGLRADVDRLLQLKADLPREISSIDVEASLPRLATLPPTGVGADDDVFSSRSSVDVVFHGGGNNGSTGSGGVDAMLAGLSDEEGGCMVQLRVFDSFDIGTIDLKGILPPAHATGRASRVLKMESHPFLSTIFLVIEQTPKEGAASSLHLLSLDLSFIPQTGRNLPLVARKVSQLGYLLRYISQVRTQLVAELKAAFDLPGRFLRNINESLAEGDENADFVFAVHHLAVTGICDPILREWLVDQVGDRGLKRWENAVGDCLEVVRRMTSECLLPAVERSLAVLSRLDGLARFGPTSSKLGLDEKNVKRVTETFDALGILGEDLLLDVITETREFTTFIRWLKWERDVEALDEDSDKTEELRELWTGEGELRLVLDYVGGAMNESRLKKYLLDETKEQQTALPTSFDDDSDLGFYAEFTKRRTSGNRDKRMPTLGELVDRLQRQCDVVFERIAETFRKSILTSYLQELPSECVGGNMDVRVIPSDSDPNLYRLFMISTDRREKALLQYVVVELRQGAGKGVKNTMQSKSIAIPEVQEVFDAKFVDDEALLVLARTASDVNLFWKGITIDGEGPWDVRHVFQRGRIDGVMKPVRLDVNGRVGRRVVTVLDESGMGLVVLDLDADDSAPDATDEEDELMTE
ncbi:anaphase-promoting complex component Cut20/Apc4 [Fonsecaea pedrosoi]|nr:anaphase-promoting complex component Cut20/Apc4 [Fonsecaea pedrosoi]